MANEKLVMKMAAELEQYQTELDCFVLARKNAGAAADKRESESDDDNSDIAHEDDSDVEDNKVAAQYHKDTNARQQSVASKKFKVDPSNELQGKRTRIPTKAAPAARARNPSEVAMENDEAYKVVCKMRIGLRKNWLKTPDEGALDKKLSMLITAIELMYTWDQRVFAEAERLRREAEMWFPNSPYVYEDKVVVTFCQKTFITVIVHESAHEYVVKMPPKGDDNMPLGLRTKIEAACPGKIRPFVSRYAEDDIEDCLRIRKSDKALWTVDAFEESVEEKAVTEDQCEPESSDDDWSGDEVSDEGSREGSDVSSEREASSSEGSGDENPDNPESSSEPSDDDEPVVVRLARREAEQEAIRKFREEYRAAQRAEKRRAEDPLLSASSKKAK